MGLDVKPQLTRFPQRWWQELRRNAWLWLITPAFVGSMTVLTNADSVTPEEIRLVYISNTTLVGAICLSITTLSVLWPFEYPLRGPRELTRFAVLNLLGMAVGSELGLRSMGLFVNIPDFAQTRRETLAIGALVTAVATVVAGIFGGVQARRLDLERRHAEAERGRLRARLEAMQLRMQPHFLFNCLNTVSNLVEEDPGQAERAIEHLANILRYAATESQADEVPLARELSAVHDYLVLERLRFEDRLQFEAHVDVDTNAIQIPPHMIQPLVENAVKHGLSSGQGRLRIELWVEETRGMLAITVEDDGPSSEASVSSGLGIALASIRERLEVRYGPKARLETASRAQGGFRARLSLPRIELDRGQP